MLSKWGMSHTVWHFSSCHFSLNIIEIGYYKTDGSVSCLEHSLPILEHLEHHLTRSKTVWSLCCDVINMVMWLLTWYSNDTNVLKISKLRLTTNRTNMKMSFFRFHENIFFSISITFQFSCFLSFKNPKSSFLIKNRVVR